MESSVFRPSLKLWCSAATSSLQCERSVIREMHVWKKLQSKAGVPGAKLLIFQVWCVESEEQQVQNWTVNSEQHSLDISALKQGQQYWITVAAVNGAGVGTLSDPHGFIISKFSSWILLLYWS